MNALESTSPGLPIGPLRMVHGQRVHAYVAVLVDTPSSPRESVKNGEIVLNIATRHQLAQARQRVHRVQGAFRRHGARDHGPRQPGDRDLRTRERPGHGVPGAGPRRARGGARGQGRTAVQRARGARGRGRQQGGATGHARVFRWRQPA